MNKLTEFLVKPFLNEDILEEGINEIQVFSRHILCWRPGSGKSYVNMVNYLVYLRKINVSKTGLKMVNQDKELEFLKK